MTVKEQKAYYESDKFKQQFIYGGDDLGAVYQKEKTIFKVWSPLAKRITLNLYRNGTDDSFQSALMKAEAKGIWEYCLDGDCHGIYYDYTVEVEGEINQTADPYARACACNGARSMVVDLARTNPVGWEDDHAPARTKEEIVYEVHVKDFSHDPASGVLPEYRGKYKAFTVTDSTLHGDGVHPTCLNYLKRLGITHVQLMPVFDYASVNEADSENQYNWGYDPLNYNVPEGSYATNPFDGAVRIRELKEAIQSLHQNGLRVIMDVVYNHTYHRDSWLNRMTPNYYYRQFEDGTYTNGSQCGNDIASEREMCSRYILDSVLYWASEYHMDGFRFDLMGLMNVELLNQIRRALDEKFGKDEIVVYGEPWSAGDSPMVNGQIPCLKHNIHHMDAGVGVFSDGTRDAIKGHVFDQHTPGFVNGAKGLEKKILHSVRAWSNADTAFAVKAPSQIVTYISAHDNLTLWDKLVLTLHRDKTKPDFLKRDEAVVRAYKMAAAVYFTTQGRPFFLAGEEAARTKLGDENSYAASSDINQLDWERTYAYQDVLEYYRGLIALRKQLSGLCDKSQTAANRIQNEAIPAKGVVQFEVANDDTDRWSRILVCYNSTEKEQNLTLPDGEWECLLDDTSSLLWNTPSIVEGKTQTIAPVSVKIMGKSGRFN